MHDFLFVRPSLSRLLCSVTPAGGAPGGGGGGGGGGGSGGTGEGGEGGEEGGEEGGKAKPMTAEQVNRAIRDHAGRMTKATDAKLAALTEQNAAMAASLEKLLKATGGEGKGAPGAGDGAQGAVSPEVTKQLADLTSKLEKQTKLAADEKAARETEHRTARTKEERSALKDALLERGVPAVQAPVLAAYLHGEAKMIGRTADGTIVYKKGEDELDLGEGLDEYLKTDAGKAWLPPRGAQGSGATGTGNGTGTRRGKGPATLEDVGAFLEDKQGR
jgi:hypothetical protein